MKSIYLDQLPFDATEEDVRALFGPYGVIHSIIIGSDRDLGELKCFALIEMDETAGQDAVREVDGKTVRGRMIEVSEAPGGSRRRTRQPPGHTAGSA
jgi:RNA recognition motif-containing protein